MTPTRQTGRIQAALAGLLLIAMVAGIPLVLLLGGGSPVPDQIPSPQDITGALTTRDDGSLFLGLLRYVAWAAWAVFTFSVLLDTWSRVRGRQVPRVAGLGRSQQLAAGLVGAFAVLFIGSPLATAATTTPPAAQPAITQQLPTAAQPATTNPTLTPARATGLVHYQVKPGDTLWDISERVIGDPTKYPRIVRATRNTEQPDGKYLTDPAHIEPGWELNVPVAKPKPKPSRTPGPAPTGPDPATSSAQPPAPTPVPDEEPARARQNNQAGAAVTTPHTNTTPTAPDRSDPADTDTEESAVLRTAGGIGALLAAGILGVLLAKRLHQRRGRRPGQKLPMPTGAAAATEHELAAVADPLTLERVDRALRTLARNCRDDGNGLPRVRMAKLNQDTFDLFLAEPAELPQPWAGTSDATVWTLAAEDADQDNQDVSDIPAPYPSLVTIGHITRDDDAGHLLIDLEHVSALGVTGDDQTVREVINALTMEMAISRWADDLQVTVVGALPDLAGTLMNGRVAYYPTAALLLDQLHARAVEESKTLRQDNTDLHQARATGQPADLCTPEIIVLATQLTDEQRTQLADAVTQRPRTAVAAITAQDSLGEWNIDLTGPDEAVLEPLGLTITPQRLDADSYDALLEGMEIAEEPPTPTAAEAAATPEPDLEELPDPPADQPTTNGQPPAADQPDPVPALPGTGSAQTPPQPATPHIKILGQVDVLGTNGPVESKKLTRLTEMCVYLALNPHATMHNLNDAIWPGIRVNTNTRNTYVAKLRRWLGTDPQGQPWLPKATAQDHYRLRPEVTTDWAQVKELVKDSVFTASDTNLAAALDLVTGKPFAGVRPNRYGWADYLTQEIIVTITDIAVELGNRHLKAGRWRDAERVATKGQLVDHLVEPLWRIRLKAAHRSGNLEGALEGAKRVELLHIQYDLDMQEETEDLIAQIRSTTPAGSTANR